MKDNPLLAAGLLLPAGPDVDGTNAEDSATLSAAESSDEKPADVSEGDEEAAAENPEEPKAEVEAEEGDSTAIALDAGEEVEEDVTVGPEVSESAVGAVENGTEGGEMPAAVKGPTGEAPGVTDAEEEPTAEDAVDVAGEDKDVGRAAVASLVASIFASVLAKH